MAGTHLKRTVTAEELASPVVPYEQAVREVLSAARALAPIRVPVAQADGLVCAEAIVARADVPAFASSAMDGYAVRADDTANASASSPVELRLLEDLPAGVAPSVAIEPGTASKIMTGAPVPPGADAVVPWEDTGEAPEGSVAVLRSFDTGRNVRPQGEDVPAGTQVIAPGAILGPVHLGVLASLGYDAVSCVPRPRVAVLSTGDELATPGEPLKPGQVYEANSVVIAALLRAGGASVVDVALVPDDRDAIAAWLFDAAATHDLIVTSGGASVGEHDWLRDIVQREGDLTMWRVAIKPGKPLAFGTLGGTRIFCLPGNPGSAFVGMHVFVLPFVRALAGRDPSPRSFTARLSSAVKGSPSRTLFCRVRTLADGRVEPLPAQSSVVLSNLLPADSFAVVPPGGLPEGAEVRVEPLPWVRA